MAKREGKWQPKRQKNYIAAGAIIPPAAISSRYRAELNALIDRMSDEYEREVNKLFSLPDVKEFFAQDDSPSSQARILTNALARRFIALFNKRSKPMAERFARQSDKANKSQVAESVKKINTQFVVPREAMRQYDSEVLSAIVTENVNLIKSIGSRYIAQVNGSVMRSITQGTGLSQLTKEIQAHKQVSKRHAEIVALDQTRKTSQALSRERYTSLGITHYTWEHRGGSIEPRQMHIDLDGTVQRYDKPILVQKATRTQPAVYGYPGTAINCRCVAIGIIPLQGD